MGLRHTSRRCRHRLFLRQSLRPARRSHAHRSCGGCVMSRQFTAQIFRWLNQVNADAELPASALKVCVELAGCFRESKKKGMAWPGLQSIADTIGKSKATVLTAIRILEQRGHLKVQYGHPGAGHSNHYWMVEKGQPANLSAQP